MSAACRGRAALALERGGATDCRQSPDRPGAPGSGCGRRLRLHSTVGALTPPRRSRHRSRPTAFTLIEFIVVMALIATLMAIVAPRLSRSLQSRNLDQEARRWVALTEFGRDQAVSQGVPMVVWLDAETSWFGLQPKPGFLTSSNRAVEFQLSEEIEFELGTVARSMGPQAVVEMAPDGYLAPDSIAVLGLKHRSGDRVLITLMTNGWGYETVTEQEYAIRQRQPRY